MSPSPRKLAKLGKKAAFDTRPHSDDDSTDQKIVFDRRLLRRVISYFHPYRFQVAFAVLAILSVGVLNLIPPLLVKGMIDDAIPRGTVSQDASALLPYVLGLVLIPLVASIIGIIQQAFTVRIGQGVLTDLREELFQHFQNQSLSYYTNTRSGEIVSRVSDDVDAIENTVTTTVVEIITNFITVLGTLIVLFVVSWPLALMACLSIPIFMVPARTVGRWRRKLVSRTQERLAELTAGLFEVLNVGGFLLIRLFDRSEYEKDRFRKVNIELSELRIQQVMAGRWFRLVIGIVASLGPALVYWYGGLLVIRGEISVGTVIAFVAYLTNLYRPMTRLAGVISDIQAALGVFVRIFDSLDRIPDVRDLPNAPEMPAISGSVTFENVTFAYREGLKPALENLSFDIQPGQLVALVGPSGAGKTTATYLLARFYDPQAGRILIDGEDISRFAQKSVTGKIAMVTQDTFLFHDTLRSNLLYARPDATSADLERVCRIAQAHDFIIALPDGYDTLVGERGVKLSGGERQRISIARALLKDPRLLILDEATSALDSSAEKLIRDALADLLKQRTTLAIAHRLSTILAADRILVLQEGRLVESGTHAELLQKNGLYTKLYHEQFGSI